ncbi:septin 7 [Nematocida sp. AWRm77]|nr:septin 7 [Nematocida sp. AWRm77]
MRISRKRERLNILLVGASGVGKSSFISTVAQNTLESVGEFAEHLITIGGKDVCFYDTRGYGAKGRTSEKLAKIVAFIKDGYKEYLLEETKVERDPEVEDRRVHLVLHFLSVSSRGIKEHDLSLLKLLHTKANVITVIPKCDYHTDEELQRIRERVQRVFAEHKIDLFSTEEVPHEKQPMALFSGDAYLVDGQVYVGRVFATGKPLVANELHSDYLLFQKVLSDARKDLLDTTHLHFYELYRSAMLSE